MLIINPPTAQNSPEKRDYYAGSINALRKFELQHDLFGPRALTEDEKTIFIECFKLRFAREFSFDSRFWKRLHSETPIDTIVGFFQKVTRIMGQFSGTVIPGGNGAVEVKLSSELKAMFGVRRKTQSKVKFAPKKKLTAKQKFDKRYNPNIFQGPRSYKRWGSS